MRLISKGCDNAEIEQQQRHYYGDLTPDKRRVLAGRRNRPARLLYAANLPNPPLPTTGGRVLKSAAPISRRPPPMPPAPRLRQLRRDKIVSDFVLNAVRLDLEDDDRLARQPALRDTPDEDLLHLRRIVHYWLGVAAIYVMRKSRCSPEAAVRVVTELREELADTIPEVEIRAVSLREVLDVPAERLPSALRPPAI